MFVRNYLRALTPFRVCPSPINPSTWDSYKARVKYHPYIQRNEIPQKIASLSRVLEFKSFQDCNGDHPSQPLIFHDSPSSWWIKVEIAWSLPETIVKLRYLKRRSMSQEFVKNIDFGQLNL